MINKTKKFISHIFKKDSKLVGFGSLLLHIPFHFGRILLHTTGIFLIIFSLYHLFYARRIVPGVVVGKVSVGGKTYNEAKKALEDYESTLNKKLVLIYEDQVFDISAEDIHLVYSHDAVVTRAFEIGRTGNFFVDTKDKAVGLFKPLPLRAFYDYEDDLLNSYVSRIKGELTEEVRDAKFAFKGSDLEIIPATEGLRVDGKNLYVIIMDSFDNMSFGNKAIPVDKVKPLLVTDDLESVFEEVTQIVFKPFRVVSENKTWSLSSQQLLELLAITRADNPKVAINLNKSRFSAYVEELGQEVNELPRGRVDQWEDKRVLDFKLIKEGREIDSAKFETLFKENLLSNKEEVAIPMRTISGFSDINKYGILALLGEGTSKYYGSAPGRIHNLTLAAERTSGVLVPPGATYSFNKSVGDVSYATGYDSAYIIKEGRTVLGEGGGVCQTSTTLFRAILNSGLPVVSRYPHAYRVRYYELDSKVGLDASVFQPTLDLKFKNDTPNYVLVQAAWDLSEQSLTFRLFGTPDGRDIKVSEPVITSVSAPPAPLYQDDPSLPKGVVRQVDFAAWGANVYFTREVSKNNELLFSDTFTSHYQPWRAVFLVGTR